MRILSLAKPIENIEDAEETKVLAVIDHLLPMLANWRAGEDLRKQGEDVGRQILENEQQLAAAKTDLLEAVADIETAKVASFNPLSIVMVIIGVVVIGASLLTGSGILPPALSPAILIGVGVVLAVIGVIIAFVRGYETKKAHISRRTKLETTQAHISTTNTDLEQKKAALDVALRARAVGFPEIQLAEVQFDLKAAEVAGRTVLLDTAGVHPAVSLATVDVSALQEGLSHISETLSGLFSVPPLLTPSDHEVIDDPIHSLFGEEGKLQQLVTDFTVNLGKVKEIKLALPIVPGGSILAQRMRAGELSVADAPAIRLANWEGGEKYLEALVSEVNRTKDVRDIVFREFTVVFQQLEQVCRLYANARMTSVNTIHQNLVEVLNRAAWCNRRIYCPRTIQASEYLEDLLNVDPDKAYLIPFDELATRLRSDQEIAKRFAAKPELERQLFDVHANVQDFIEGAVFDEEGTRVDAAARPRHIESQFQEAVKKFKATLQKVITGAAHPILNFSTEAQLYFDPEDEQWSSPVTPYTYSSADAEKYGSVVKAYSDLMIPLWEHLWTEKADFRKSELFRTNESMLRMTEKESEKLIDIANQFRADMRTVRENIYNIESELKSKCSEIVFFRNSMESLGLLSPRVRETVSDDKLAGLRLEKSTLAGSDRYETVLGAMPQTQAETRGTVHDPISIIKEPQALVRSVEPPRARLTSQ